MTAEQVAALGPAFAAYLRQFEGCFLQDRTREHLHTYCRGLLSDLPRKSVEPIALEQLERAASNGLHPHWLTFDAYYGGKPAFLAGLDARPGTYWIGEVPRNFRCLTRRPRGRRPPGGYTGKRVDQLARYSAARNRQEWQDVQLARLTLADQAWEVRAGQVYLPREG